MPRSIFQDKLQAHRFWLMDIAPIDPLSVPVLTPLFGFSAISAPEITLETEPIPQGNYPFPRNVIKGGSLNSLTLTRGAAFVDSDFYRWIMAAAMGDTEVLQNRSYGVGALLQTGVRPEGFGVAGLTAAAVAGSLGFPRVGGPTYRRDLLLIQFFPQNPISGLTAAALFSTVAGLGSLATGQAINTTLAFATAGVTVATESSDGTNAQIDSAKRLPARAWSLKGVIPTRYKVASDFAADDASISQMDLDIVYDDIEEVSLSS